MKTPRTDDLIMALKATPEYTKEKDTDRDRALHLCRQLERELAIAHQSGVLEGLRLKRQDPRAYFSACEHCEPIMCCGGQECGCQAMPTDFTPTDKCEGNCVLKCFKERDQLQQSNTKLAKENAELRETMLKLEHRIKSLEQNLRVFEKEL